MRILLLSVFFLFTAFGSPVTGSYEGRGGDGPGSYFVNFVTPNYTLSFAGPGYRVLGPLGVYPAPWSPDPITVTCGSSPCSALSFDFRVTDRNTNLPVSFDFVSVNLTLAPVSNGTYVDNSDHNPAGFVYEHVSLTGATSPFNAQIQVMNNGACIYCGSVSGTADVSGSRTGVPGAYGYFLLTQISLTGDDGASATPEPASLGLMGFAVTVLAYRRCRTGGFPQLWRK